MWNEILLKVLLERFSILLCTTGTKFFVKKVAEDFLYCIIHWERNSFESFVGKIFYTAVAIAVEIFHEESCQSFSMLL